MSLSMADIPRNFGYNTRLNVLDSNFHYRANGINLRSPDLLVVNILKGFGELPMILGHSDMNIRPLAVQNGYWIDSCIIAVSPTHRTIISISYI